MREERSGTISCLSIVDNHDLAEFCSDAGRTESVRFS